MWKTKNGCILGWKFSLFHHRIEVRCFPQHVQGVCMKQVKEQYLVACWDKIIEYLITNQSVEPEVIDTFYKPAYIHSFDENKVIIIGENTIAVEIMSEQLELLKFLFVELFELPNPIEVEIVRVGALKQKKAKKAVEVIPELFDSSFYDEDGFGSMPIRKDCTFRNFVKGDCNRESQVASLACAHAPGKSYNPLFIYGNSGLGKTHLLMAIGNYVKAKYPTMNVYYVESNTFVQKVVKAIQNNKIEDFKKFMCEQDILLIDDIQFLAGKEKSHEVFFTIYNYLVSHNKQICIASDRHPKDIKGLEDRLISRFSSGLSVGIDTPEFETSLAILKMKLQNTSIDATDIDNRGLEYIASNFNNNVRELEGALNRVMFYAINFGDPADNIDGVIGFDTVCSALKNETTKPKKDGHKLDCDQITKEVADYYGLTKQQLVGKTRTRNIANARHIAIYLSRKLLTLSYTKIGDEFGGRDHSTIMSSCTKVEKLIKKDPAYDKAVKDIQNLLK